MAAPYGNAVAEATNLCFVFFVRHVFIFTDYNCVNRTLCANHQTRSRNKVCEIHKEAGNRFAEVEALKFHEV